MKNAQVCIVLDHSNFIWYFFTLVFFKFFFSLDFFFFSPSKYYSYIFTIKKSKNSNNMFSS